MTAFLDPLKVRWNGVTGSTVICSAGDLVAGGVLDGTPPATRSPALRLDDDFPQALAGEEELGGFKTPEEFFEAPLLNNCSGRRHTVLHHFEAFHLLNAKVYEGTASSLSSEWKKASI